MDQTQPTAGRSRRAFLAGGLRLGAMAAVVTVPAGLAATEAHRVTDGRQTTAHGGALHLESHGGVAHEHSGVSHTHGVMVHALDERTIRAVDTAQPTTGPQR